jgi:hypothetical protein
VLVHDSLDVGALVHARCDSTSHAWSCFVFRVIVLSCIDCVMYFIGFSHVVAVPLYIPLAFRLL